MKYEPLFELERTGVQMEYYTNIPVIYPVHWYSAVELIYILNGNAGIMIEGKDYEDIREKEAREDDLAFCRAVSVFFPKHYPFEKMGKVFLGLQALLESEYEFVPELAMEYVR